MSATSILFAHPKGMRFDGTLVLHGTAGGSLIQLGNCSGLETVLARAIDRGYGPLVDEWTREESGSWRIAVELHPDTIIDRAQARAELSAGTEWRDAANRALERIATRQLTLTSDDVWGILADQGLDEPPTPSAMGAVFTAGAKRGLIAITTERRRTQRHQAHRKIYVWRSLVFEPGDLFGEVSS